MGIVSDTPVMTMEQAVERIYALKVGTIGSGSTRHERPHKPVLMLAVLDCISTDEATSEKVPWSQDLRNRFTEYFEKVRQLNDDNTPENPFFYLRGDGFWQPILVSDGAEMPLERTPTVSDATIGRVFAKLVNGFEQCVREGSQRLRLREAIISRYFPHKRIQLEPLFLDKSPAEVTPKPEGNEAVGRNPAFRRKVLEVYDSQCAACGLRIRLPEEDMTFVDGAHLIPFTVSRNDHPTNGIALCKNHHWAMDRFLIVPTSDRCWKSSPILDSRRSLGEKELCELNNRPLLPPHDDAFRPAAEGLIWRASRLRER